jgi:hypothetical protein
MKNEDREKIHKIWKQNMRETMDLALDLVKILENFYPCHVLVDFLSILYAQLSVTIHCMNASVQHFINPIPYFATAVSYACN